MRRPLFWLGALGIPMLLMGLGVAALERWGMPNFEVEWGPVFRAAMLVAVVFPAALMAMAQVPEMIVVNRRGIRWGNRWRLPEAIRRLTVDLAEPDRPRLRVEFEPATRNPARSFLGRWMTMAPPQPEWTLGVGRRVDPAVLTACLKTLFPSVSCEVLTAGNRP